MKTIAFFCSLVSIIPALANDDFLLSPPSSKPCLPVQQEECQDGNEFLLSLEATAPFHLKRAVVILRLDTKNNPSISFKTNPALINGERSLPSLPILLTGIPYPSPLLFKTRKIQNLKILWFV